MANPSPTPGRFAPAAVLAVTLLVFAIVVTYVSLWVRSGLQEQVLRREADTLSEVASWQLSMEADAVAGLGEQEVPGQLLSAVLKTSKLRGVFAVRVFDAQKRFAGALPIAWSEAPPPNEDWVQLSAGVPLARLHSRESAAEVIGIAPATRPGRKAEPLLETWLPLRRGETAPLAGVAQMWTNGEAVAREFASLDQRLLTQAVLAWLAGALIISFLLSWAFRRLAQANRDLRARSEDLVRANRELALAAKTSALGAVTAHLMHELKNPVAGLEEFVASRSEMGNGGELGGELAAASELTRRLRTMINDVVGVMRDEQTDANFELSGSDIAEVAVSKVRPLAQGRNVTVLSDVRTSANVPARRANLAVLVLQNLLQNAAEASPEGGTVRVMEGAEDLSFVVADEGPGLSGAVRERLFQPCASSKRGGTGLGLALSQQLARQAGGKIELLATSPAGTRFQLVLGPEQ